MENMNSKQLPQPSASDRDKVKLKVNILGITTLVLFFLLVCSYWQASNSGLGGIGQLPLVLFLALMFCVSLIFYLGSLKYGAASADSKKSRKTIFSIVVVVIIIIAIWLLYGFITARLV
jgi:hypothetical protein